MTRVDGEQGYTPSYHVNIRKYECIFARRILHFCNEIKLYGRKNKNGAQKSAAKSLYKRGNITILQNDCISEIARRAAENIKDAARR